MSTSRGLRWSGTAALLSLSLNSQLLAQVDTIPKGRLFGWREALAFGHGIALLFKGIVGRARPYHNPENPHDYQLFRGFGQNSSPYRSMPSSHTISAFAAASAVTSETSRWWPASVWYVAPMMYGGAALSGVSRMYNNKHWASDVITGAAIGTMAGIMVVRWHHMNPGNAADQFFLGASIRSTSSGRVVSLHAFPMF